MTESPKTARGRQTRERIVSSAAELIGERGVAETSLDDVIERADASKSQLYHYFDDREALLRAVVAHNTDGVLAAQPHLESLDTWKAIRDWFDSLVQLQVERNAQGGCPVGSLVGQLAECDEGARLALEGSFGRWEDQIRYGLRAMKAQGKLDRRADPDELATATMAAIQGGLLLTQIRRDPASSRSPWTRPTLACAATRRGGLIGFELLAWAKPYYPAYYFPVDDVNTALLEPDDDDDVGHSPSRGGAWSLTIRAGGKEAPGAALRYEDSPIEELRDAIRLEWDAMDAWFEEDEEVFTHPRDPYTRVDILPSSRHVRVEVDGATIAESAKPTLLFETGLPERYYLPKPHVRLDLLTATDTVSHCPYKGQAEYWSVPVDDTVHADLAWSYRTPLPESQKIAGLISFYNERVDLYVDGERQDRPTTKFS